VGKNDKEFLNKVKELFFNQHGINPSLTGQVLLDTVINIVKKIRKGQLIKDLFREALTQVKISTKKSAITDLNTTAKAIRSL
jgi:hypothetical protein